MHIAANMSKATTTAATLITIAITIAIIPANRTTLFAMHITTNMSKATTIHDLIHYLIHDSHDLIHNSHDSHDLIHI